MPPKARDNTSSLQLVSTYTENIKKYTKSDLFSFSQEAIIFSVKPSWSL